MVRASFLELFKFRIRKNEKLEDQILLRKQQGQSYLSPDQEEKKMGLHCKYCTVMQMWRGTETLALCLIQTSLCEPTNKKWILIAIVRTVP